jgi:hypothetical protein
VQVRASSLSSEAIRDALSRGDFYASTGVKIKDIRASDSEYTVEVELASWEKVTTYFIGPEGKVLGRSFEPAAVYRFEGPQAYVRARVESSSGARAWTQPCSGTAAPT